MHSQIFSRHLLMATCFPPCIGCSPCGKKKIRGFDVIFEEVRLKNVMINISLQENERIVKYFGEDKNSSVFVFGELAKCFVNLLYTVPMPKNDGQAKRKTETKKAA